MSTRTKFCPLCGISADMETGITDIRRTLMELADILKDGGIPEKKASALLWLAYWEIKEVTP